MNRKTIRLPSENGYAIVEGEVCCLEYVKSDLSRTEMEYIPTQFRVGERGTLFCRENVSPNALRSGRTHDQWGLRFGEDGIPGNSNHEITRYHGWRGTTNDVSISAHGYREIVAIRELKNGDIAVTVGPDLRPDAA